MPIKTKSPTVTKMAQFVEFYGTGYDVPKIEYPVPPITKLTLAESVNAIRKLIKLKSSYGIPTEVDDKFITRFLYARKMNIEASFQLMQNYFSYRKNNPSLFINLSAKDPQIQLAFKDGLPCVLKNRDRKGRCVLLFLVYQWEHSMYSMDMIFRSLLLSMEYLLDEAQNQVNGFVFVFDWSNIKFRDYTGISVRMIKLMIDGFQDSFPAKIKGVHFVGQPWYLDGIFTIAKAFLKEKTRQKLMFHGTNLSTLHQYLPRDVAPPELGGDGTTYNPAEWINLLCLYSERNTEV